MPNITCFNTDSQPPLELADSELESVNSNANSSFKKWRVVWASSLVIKSSELRAMCMNMIIVINYEFTLLCSSYLSFQVFLYGPMSKT